MRHYSEIRSRTRKSLALGPRSCERSYKSTSRLITRTLILASMLIGLPLLNLKLLGQFYAAIAA